MYCIITQYVKTVGQIDELEGWRGGGEEGHGGVFSLYFSILLGEEEKKEI